MVRVAFNTFLGGWLWHFAAAFSCAVCQGTAAPIPGPDQATAQRPNAQDRPNIVMIISDDQSWTDYGFMGHPHIKTPRLDELARQSVVFRRGYVATALCRPSLATLITGLYAHQHGITGNDPAGIGLKRNSQPYQSLRHQLIAKLDDCPKLPKLLAEQGYLSFQCGKWWEGNYQNGGFTHGMTKGFPNPGGRHGDHGLTIGREGIEPIREFLTIAEEEEKPFFLWYAPFLPHEPHNPPKELLQHYLDRGLGQPEARYFAMCEWFDQTCGEILDELDQRQLSDRTLVVYVTDNGWIQRETQSNGGSFAARSKQSPYEGGVRTPILFRWPGHLEPTERPELCSSIDLVPTLLAAAGASTDRSLPGINLMPSIRRGEPIARDTIYGESFAHDIADLADPSATLNHRWVIQGDWKLILSYDGAQLRVKHPVQDYRPQLYDLSSDPHEQNNLAGREPERLKELVSLLKQWYPVPRRSTVTSWTDNPVKVPPQP